MAVAVTDDSTIRAANTNSKYEKGSFDNDPELPVNTAKHSWINYIHCGYKVRFSFCNAATCPNLDWVEGQLI